MRRCLEVTIRKRNISLVLSHKPVLPCLTRTYISPYIASSQKVEDPDEVEEQEFRLRQLTSNARTLIRAKRHSDAEKVIDEGLEMMPWQSALWFWKLVTKVGNSKGALEVWETMRRLGIDRLPEHYDIMSNAVVGTEAKHVCIELFDEAQEEGTIGNLKFYHTVMNACQDPRLLMEGKRIWNEMQKSAQLSHLCHEADMQSSYVTLLDNIEIDARITDKEFQDILKPGQVEATPMNHDSPPDASPRYGVVDDGVSRTDDEMDSGSSRISNISGQEIGGNPQSPLSAAAVTVSDQFAPDGKHATEPPVMDHAELSDHTTELRNAIAPHYRRLNQQPNSAHRQESFESAKATLLESTDTNTHINAYNYVLRFATKSGQNSREMLSLLETSIDRGLRPDAGTYNPIISRLFFENKADEALDLIERMETSNVRFNLKTVEEVLYGLFRVSRPDAAMEFFVDIFKAETDILLSPGRDGELRCFNVAIAGLCACDRLVDAQNLIQVMIERNISPNLDTYAYLVLASFRAGLVIDGMKYFDLATSMPNLRRLNFEWKEDLDELVSSVVRGFLIHNRYDEAEKLMRRCIEEDLWHNTQAKPWCSFITFLASRDRVEEAWTLFDFQVANTKDEFSRMKLYGAALVSIYLDRGDLLGARDWWRRMQRDLKRWEQGLYVRFLAGAMVNGERKLGEQVWDEAREYLRRSGERPSEALKREGRRWSLEM